MDTNFPIGDALANSTVTNNLCGIRNNTLPLTKSLDLKNGDFYYYSKDKEVSS